jgi:hypothetical protein
MRTQIVSDLSRVMRNDACLIAHKRCSAEGFRRHAGIWGFPPEKKHFASRRALGRYEIKWTNLAQDFFSADKAQNVAVLVVQRGFAPPLSVFPLHAKACGKKATQSDGKKTSQMSNLFRNAS